MIEKLAAGILSVLLLMGLVWVLAILTALGACRAG